VPSWQHLALTCSIVCLSKISMLKVNAFARLKFHVCGFKVRKDLVNDINCIINYYGFRMMLELQTIFLARLFGNGIIISGVIVSNPIVMIIVFKNYTPCGWWMPQMQHPPHLGAMGHLYLECHELARGHWQQCLLIFYFSHNRKFCIPPLTNSELEHHQQDCR